MVDTSVTEDTLLPHGRFGGRGRFLIAGMITVVMLALLALLAIGLQGDPQASVSPLLGHPAPAVTLKTLDGTQFSLAHLRGRPIVLNFWASWCVGCKLEHPYLLRA